MSALIGFRSLAIRSVGNLCFSRAICLTSTAPNVLNNKALEAKPIYKPLAFSGVRLSSSHDHSKLWSMERVVSASLLALIPASMALSVPGADYALALALVAHVHWGVEAIVVDYIRPSIFGAVIPKVSQGLVFLLSALALSGLWYFNYTDVGIGQGLKMAWKHL